jgi:hypothetical protein
MADKGIIFSAPMVRGLIREAENPGSGKTNTRRLLRLRGYPGMHEFGPSDTPGYDWHFRRADACWCDVTDARLRELLPYAPGDRLYVREAHYLTDDGHHEMVAYALDEGEKHIAAIKDMQRRYGLSEDWAKPRLRLRPSIHMPRWASRLTLLVTDVRVQRVAEISEADARAEGLEWVAPTYGVSGLAASWSGDPRESFRTLWNSLHTKPGERWEDNPWVCAVSFTVRHGNIDRSDR